MVIKHKANRMGASDSKLEEVWYMDSGASNHMTNHKEWFSFHKKPEKLGLVETGDDTPHPIEHIGDVALSHVSQNPTCSIDHQELGVSWPNHGSRNAG